MQLQPKKTYSYPKITAEKSACDPDTAINVLGPYIEYSRWENIFVDIGFIDLSKIDPLELPLDLSTAVANEISKLSIINISEGLS